MSQPCKQVVKLKVHVMQFLNVEQSQRNVTPTRHETHIARQNIL